MTRKKLYIFILVMMSFVLMFMLFTPLLYDKYIADSREFPDFYGYNNNIFEGVDVERPEGEREDEITQRKKTNEKGKLQETKTADSATSKGFPVESFKIVGWVILLIISAYIFYRFKKKKLSNLKKSVFKREKKSEMSALVFEKPLDPSQDLTSSNLSGARKALYNFNIHLPTHLQKAPSETITDWFERINFSTPSKYVYDIARYKETDEAIAQQDLIEFEEALQHYLIHNNQIGE